MTKRSRQAGIKCQIRSSSWGRKAAIACRAPVEVRALGAEGWRDVRRSGPYPGMPGRVGPSCISFWRGGELLAAPHAMAPGGAGEPLRADFVGVIAGAGSGKNTQFPPGLTKS